MSDNEFFEIPGASGDTGGSGEGQGASEPASTDRNTAFEARLNRMGDAIQTLVDDRKKSEKNSEVETLKGRITAAIRKKVGEVDAAEAALADAYEEGEGAAIAKAQRTLSSLTATVERMKAEGQNAINQLEAKAKVTDAGGSPTDADTANLDRWKTRNATWFGVDNKMTQEALAIGRTIETAGMIETGSHQYYEAIDREMQRKFPDRLKGSPGGAPQSTDTGGTTPGVTRIPQAVADGWRRMGINIDDPEVAKRMLGHRQTAVEKDILPSQPAYGRVIER